MAKRHLGISRRNGQLFKQDGYSCKARGPASRSIPESSTQEPVNHATWPLIHHFPGNRSQKRLEKRLEKPETATIVDHHKGIDLEAKRDRKRPWNSFIVYRRAYKESVSTGYHEASISKQLSTKWHRESETTKNYFRNIAEILTLQRERDTHYDPDWTSIREAAPQNSVILSQDLSRYLLPPQKLHAEMPQVNFTPHTESQIVPNAPTAFNFERLDPPPVDEEATRNIFWEDCVPISETISDSFLLNQLDYPLYSGDGKLGGFLQDHFEAEFFKFLS